MNSSINSPVEVEFYQKKIINQTKKKIINQHFSSRKSSKGLRKQIRMRLEACEENMRKKNRIVAKSTFFVIKRKILII